VAVGKNLLPAVDCFLQVLQQVVVEMDVGLAARKETVLLQAVVGKD
jgi:hypothetical protein